MTNLREAAARIATPVRLRLVEAVLVVVAPLLFCVAYRTWPMAVGLDTRWTMIDPSFYTAYAMRGPELAERFGLADYWWVRMGFILPAHLTYALFGAVPGFVVLRYAFALLAIVPGYLLFRRVAGLPAAITFAVLVLTSPVVVMAWGSDYPDAAVVTYLLAAIPALLMPGADARVVLGWRVFGGVLLGLALNSHAACVPLVLAALVVPPVLRRRAAGQHRGVVATVSAMVVTTAAMAFAAQLYFGSWDIFSPTFRQDARLQTPTQAAIWHSPGVGWMNRDTYLLVPLLLLGAWLVLRRRRADDLGQLTTAAATILAVQAVLFAFVQFGRNGFALEYYFYSSMLWPSVLLLLAALLAGLMAENRLRWIVPAIAALVPWVAELTGSPAYPVVWVGLAVLVVVPLLIGVIERLRGSGWRPVAAGLLVLGAFSLTVGQSPSIGYAPDQVHYPFAAYGKVLGTDGQQSRDIQRVVTLLPSLVPVGLRSGHFAMWYQFQSGTLPPEVIVRASAQYLGPIHALSPAMPDLKAADQQRLDAMRSGQILLLSTTGTDFPQAMSALARWRPRLVAVDTFSSGSVVLHAELVELAGLQTR